MKYLTTLAVLWFCIAADAQQLPSSLGGAGEGLGERFDSALAGISLCPPAGSVQAKATENSDLLAEFTNSDRQWDLKVMRVRTNGPATLTTAKDAKGEVHKGIQETVVEELQQQLAGAEIVRNDQTNVADSYGEAEVPAQKKKYPNVGMIAVRYMEATSPRLMQRAIIQGDDLYYMLDFTSPGAKPGTPVTAVDPQEKAAVDVFTAMLDTVRLHDNADIKEEQIQRLFRTHAFYYNLTPAAYKRVLAPEQWFRLVRDGKDIGYTRITEEVVTPATREGVRVTVRSRMYPAFPAKTKQLDSESEMFCAFDRSHEEWTSSSSLVSEGQAPVNVAEVGISDRTFKSIEKKAPPIIGNFRAPATQPAASRTAEVYKLSVTFSHGSVKPLTRDLLPPYYLQQALGHLLPKLLPVDRVQTYLFATYVPEQREVVMRYVDVGKDRDVTFFGEKFHAVPISDRLGYEGTPTIHYVSMDGKYLGSINPQSKTGLVPSDQAEIEGIFSKQSP